MKPKPIILSSQRKEFLQSDFNGLPVAFYISDFESSFYDYIDWHWHDEVQYCLVIKGEVLFKVNKDSYVITEGNGIFINSRQVHTSKPVHSHSAIYYCFEFNPNMLCNDTNRGIYHSYILPIITDSKHGATVLQQEHSRSKDILTSIKNVKEILDHRVPTFEMDLLIEIIKIWKNTFLDADLPKDSAPIMTRENDRLRNILQFIHENYEEELTLDLISKAVHLSRSECSRFFQKYTGQGLFQYITQYRIQKSLELLGDSQKSIADIAHEVGFKSQSYYTECFKKQLSMTPRQFRAASNSSLYL